MTGAFAPGAAGWVVYAEETTPQTWVTPIHPLWATAAGNTDTPGIIRRSYFAGYRAAETGLAPGKVVSGGNISWPLMPNAGMHWLKYSLGKEAILFSPNYASDTSAGSVTTASGQSTFALTTGGSYNAGDSLAFNTSGAVEYRTIRAYNSGSKVVTVDALVANAAATSGKTVRIAVSDVTMTSAVSTDNQISTFTLTTDKAYVPGQWVQIGTGANIEMRQVRTYTAGTKMMTVAALIKNAAAAAGLAVVAPTQHVFSLRTPLDANWGQLPTASVAFAEGGLYDWQHPGCLAGSFALAGDANDITTTLALVPTADAVYNATPTAFSPTATEESDQSDFWTINHGLVVTPVDYDATGTSSFGMNKTVTAWGLTVNNGIINKDHYNLRKHTEGYAGLAKITGTYSYTNHAKRKTELQDFLLSDYDNETPIMVSLANFTGPGNTPQCCGIYVPNAKIVAAASTLNVNDFESVAVSWEADRPTGGDIIQVYVLNQQQDPY